MNSLQKTLLTFLLSFTTIALITNAITWPTTPTGEVSGGKIMNLLTKSYYDTGTTSNGLIKQSASVGDIGGSPVLTVSGGNVGIGISSPTAKLNVNNIGVGSINTVRLVENGAIGGAMTHISLDNTGATADLLYLRNKGNGNAFNVTVNSGNAFIINGSGNVGIGTTTPLAKLDISGFVKINTLNSHLMLAGASSNGMLQVNNNTLKLGNWDVVTRSLNIDLTNGNVGIGTATPNKLLHLQTTSGTNAELDIQSGTKPYWGIYHDETTEQLRFWNGTDRVTFSSGGNVGIGTNNPLSKLSINAALNGSPGGLFIDAKTRDPAETNVPLIKVDAGIAGSNLTAFWINTSGNVGIGTTSPSEKLEVAGKIKSTSGGFVFPDGTTQTTAASSGPVAWVNFNGTSCSPNCTIRASHNISSVTRSSVGYYVINFMNPLIDSNYVVTGTAEGTVSYNGWLQTGYQSLRTQSLFGVHVVANNPGWIAFDSANINIAVFR